MDLNKNNIFIKNLISLNLTDLVKNVFLNLKQRNIFALKSFREQKNKSFEIINKQVFGCVTKLKKKFNFFATYIRSWLKFKIVDFFYLGLKFLNTSQAFLQIGNILIRMCRFRYII